jgi:hypothetical protein
VDRVSVFVATLPHWAFCLAVAAACLLEYLACGYMVLLTARHRASAGTGRGVVVFGLITMAIAILGTVISVSPSTPPDDDIGPASTVFGALFALGTVLLGAAALIRGVVTYARGRRDTRTLVWAGRALGIGLVTLLIGACASQRAVDFSEAYDIATAEGVNLRRLPYGAAFPAGHFASSIVLGETTEAEGRRIMRYARSVYRCAYPARGGGPIVFKSYAYADSYFFLSRQPITGHLVTVWYDENETAVAMNVAQDSAYYVPDVSGCRRLS